MRSLIMFAFALMMAVMFLSPGGSVAGESPLVSGRTLVLFGERTYNRNETVIAGVERALADLPGITVLIPRQRPYSLRDADLRDVETVVEIFAAEVIRREDRYQSFYLGGIAVSGTLTEIRVRLGLRFLRVSGNAHYLELIGSREAEGFASGMTYTSAYTRWGSYAVTSYPNLETAAFKSAAASILGR
jgi:hypothetical protein